MAGAVWLEKIPKAKARQTEAAGDGEGSDVFACANAMQLLRSSDVFAASGESDVFPAQKSARGKFYYQKAGRNGIDAAIEPRRGGARSEPCRSKNREGARLRSCALSNNANCFRIANLFQTIMKFFAPLSFKKAGKLPSFLFLFAVARAPTPAAAAGAGTALFARADREKERSRDGEDEDRGDDHGGQIRLQPRHFYNAPPSRRTSSRTIPAKTHATAHWSKTTRVAQRTPSSRRIEAIAAIQGV